MPFRSLGFHWRKDIQIILLLLGCLTAAFFTYAEWGGLVRMHLLRYDYSFFYYAFHVVLLHQPASNLYNATTEHLFLVRWPFPSNPHNHFVYPPQFALIGSIFGLLPFRVSADVWIAVSIFFYGLGIGCRAQAVFQSGSDHDWMVHRHVRALAFATGHFCVKTIIGRFPQLFWMHAQMFEVLLSTFFVVVVQAFRQRFKSTWIGDAQILAVP